ncbi:hypothetical protein M422DRAFT_26710 [Sphaerobolus stellatus SS14]|nr:hypothetical protein M422DRAFT_26710 [Sphaerobolus stellatus SS14]
MVLSKPDHRSRRRSRPSKPRQPLSRPSPFSPLPILDIRARKLRRRRSSNAAPLRQPDREELGRLAEETLSIIQDGSYVDAETGLIHNIAYHVSASIEKTCIYSSSSTGLIDNWQDGPRLMSLPPSQQTQIEFLNMPPLKGARELARTLRSAGDSDNVGFLNCPTAKRPGGSSLKGGIEQEECLARASTISASLTSLTASPFYRAHKHDDSAGFYDHQVIFTPNVVVIRGDRRPQDRIETGGGKLIQPFQMSVVSSCAINAQQIRAHRNGLSSSEVNHEIENVMRARMARILRVFEERGIRNLLLGAFGVGQPFHNNLETIARIWAELLACPNSAFRHVFDRVWFAVDSGQGHLSRFQNAFYDRVFEDEFTLALTDEEPDGEDWERVF